MVALSVRTDYTVQELKRHEFTRGRIRNLRKALARLTFREEGLDRRHYIAQTIAFRIMELTLQLPTDRPDFPTELTLQGAPFVPVRQFQDGSVVYRRGGGSDRIRLAPSPRPDIQHQFAYLFK